MTHGLRRGLWCFRAYGAFQKATRRAFAPSALFRRQGVPIYIGRGLHRRGAGRALYTTLFELLRHLGYYTATAGITLPNAASVGLHEDFGFTLVGVYRDIGHKMGAWHDVAWYQTTVQPASAQPSDPRPIGAIHGSPSWHDAVARGVALYAERA